MSDYDILILYYVIAAPISIFAIAMIVTAAIMGFPLLGAPAPKAPERPEIPQQQD